ncbi:unnamed protein product, partial [Ascophyllum nodosum]
ETFCTTELEEEGIGDCTGSILESYQPGKSRKMPSEIHNRKREGKADVASKVSKNLDGGIESNFIFMTQGLVAMATALNSHVAPAKGSLQLVLIAPNAFKTSEENDLDLDERRYNLQQRLWDEIDTKTREIGCMWAR